MASEADYELGGRVAFWLLNAETEAAELARVLVETELIIAASEGGEEPELETLAERIGGLYRLDVRGDLDVE